MANPLRILFAIGQVAIFNLVATQRSLWQTGRVPQDLLELVSGGPELLPLVRIWIDTDAACGATGRVVPDDCFAMLYGPVPVLFRPFEGIPAIKGRTMRPTIWPRYTVTSSSGMRFALRRVRRIRKRSGGSFSLRTA